MCIEVRQWICVFFLKENEKKQENSPDEYMKELAELISQGINNSAMPDRIAILQEITRQIRRIKQEGTVTTRICHAVVSLITELHIKYNIILKEFHCAFCQNYQYPVTIVRRPSKILLRNS